MRHVCHVSRQTADSRAGAAAGRRRPARPEAAVAVTARTRCASSTRATLWRNPVMFIVEIGAVFTTVWRSPTRRGSPGLITVWLWLTVVFANLAEAVAEGRGKAQAATLRKAKTGHHRPPADRLAARAPRRGYARGGGRRRRSCSRATSSWSRPAQIIPGDGDVVEGIASVDESAITGESAPVIRESGGDRRAVTGGTKVLSDRIVVQDHPEAGRELHRPDDRPGRGRQPAEDARTRSR